MKNTIKNEQESVNKIRKQGNILGIEFTSTTYEGLLREIRVRLANLDKTEAKQGFFIATPNPEHICLSTHDPLFKKALENADVRIPDAVGIVMADRYLEMKIPNTFLVKQIVLLLQGLFVGASMVVNKNWLFEKMKVVKGRELFVDLIALANKMRLKVFLLGGSGDTASRTVEVLSRSFKSVNFSYHPGPTLDNRGLPINQDNIRLEKEAIDLINKFKPDLLFVAFGAPKQEKWVLRWKKDIKASVIMVVGGSFDYITGKMHIPPKLFSNLGLEWFWRLISEPRRIGRIFNAVIVFPMKIFLYRLRN